MVQAEKAGNNRASGLKSVYDSKSENEKRLFKKQLSEEEGESTETGAGAYMEN